MSMALYEIAAEYRDAVAKLEAMEDLDADTIRDTLESISGPLENKVLAVAAHIRNTRAEAEAMKVAEEGIAKRRKARENHAERMEAYLLNCMQSVGMEKVGSPQLGVAVRKNPDKLPTIGEDARLFIPARFWKVIPESEVLDGVALKAALKAGEQIGSLKLTNTYRVEIK